MTSLTPIRPPSSASTRSSTPAAPPNPVFRHQHSLSSSTPGGQHFGALSPHYGGARSAGGPRQSLDASKALATSGPISPRITSGNPLRPNSEMLGVGGQQLFGGPSLEAEAIDKWFEDLQSYEATLEEMAAASLDVNFKEELSAIEQWFRVLSEAERTAALYSLLQSSTQVQIRFFITVLQQMARSDPMTALLSPAPSGSAASMEQQMEAKLAQLSMKSPASPVVRQFARQSLGAGINPNNPTESYLSPNSALLNESTGSISGNANSIAANEAAILLANQRAKLKASSANRVSAPGQLLGDSTLKSPKWNNQSGTVEEESSAKTRSPSPRPKSTPGDLNSSGHPNAPHAALARAAAASGGVSGLESQLSPIVGGSWASQVNTPLVPMFANKEEGAGHDPPSARAMDDASTRLAQWGAAHQAGSSSVNTSPAPAQPPNTNNDSSPTSGIQLDDARKFRRQSKGLQGSVSTSTPFSGVLSGLGSSGQNSNHNNVVQSSLSHSVPANSQQPYVGNRNGNPMSNSFGGPRSALHVNNVGGGMPSPITTQSLINAQQAAMAAQQTWRNGLGSPSVAPAPTDQPMVNNLSMMNTLAGLNAGININGMANMAAMANMSDPNALQNMANLLNMQQQMQQAQHLHALQQQMQQNGMMGGMLGPNGQIISPLSARLGMSFPAGFPMLGTMPNNKRSPTGRSPVGKPSHTPGSGSNPDEELDMKLLSDIPSWLRGLRLHKYTPNFEGCTWQEMVLMSDSDLDARGVAAVGARRKMLRTFETVRIKKGMALPGDGEMKEEKKESAAGDLEKTTNTTPTPESDRA